MKICFPHRPGLGGPGSFQLRFETALKKFGHTISYAGREGNPDLIMVVGGTIKLGWLLKMKMRGLPIIYRLDGLLWLHHKQNVGIKKFLIDELRNLSNKIIHSYIADKIIYQSYFVKDWWDEKGWRKCQDFSIIYNGSEIPQKEDLPFNNQGNKRLVIVEGTVDYTPYAIELLNLIAENLESEISIEVYGRFKNSENINKLNKRIQYFGIIPRHDVTTILKGSVYLSLDINPACPNTVIEALSYGAPTVAYDTGSIKEILNNEIGAIIDNNRDPWSIKMPDTSELLSIITIINDNYSYYSRNAYAYASKYYNINKITKQYLKVLLECK